MSVDLLKNYVTKTVQLFTERHYALYPTEFVLKSDELLE